MLKQFPVSGRCWTAAAVLISALMLFATACGGGGDEDPPNCTFGVASGGDCVNSEQCFFPSDCLPGYSCTQGTCTADQECSADADCDRGVCGSDGVCVNAEECSSNTDCVSKTFCAESGECLPDPCENVTCVRGTCTPGSGQCVSEDTCTPDNQLFDCIQGERCLNETCLDSEEFCNELTCDRGVCSFNDGECVSADDCGGDDSQCLEGEFCNANDACEQDRCVANNVTCDEGVCMPSTGECQNAESCASNEECLADHWCIEGTCELQSMACGDADGEGGCFGNQSCVYDESSQTASCEAPDVCTTSLDCLDGTQCGGESCLPTVACADDLYEPNDANDDATVFTDVDDKQLVEASLCSSDTDIYTFNLGDLEPTVVRGLVSIQLRYAERDIGLGEIQLELFEQQDDDSYTSVATGTAGPRGQDGMIELTHEVGPSTVGEFRLEVTGASDISDAGISYDLGIDMIDDLVVDACENARVLENGDILTADLRQATSSLLRHSCSRGDAESERAEQVFVFDMEQAGRATVVVTPETDTEDPVVSIRESCTTYGTEVACADTSGETDSIDAKLLDPGTYFVVVSASPEGSLNRYDVSLNITEESCSPSSSYCEDANSSQICVGGTGLTGVDCTSGCNPTSGRCFPIDGNVCETTTEITADTTESIVWGELSNEYQGGAASCVPSTEGASQTNGPDQAFQVTIPDQEAIRATLDVGDSDEASLYLVESCQDVSGTCLTGVNAEATGDETLIWANRTGSDVTAFLIADSSDTALLPASQLSIEFVELVCDPQGADASICDPNNSDQVLDCSDNGIEYSQGESCDGFGCDSGSCTRPDTCANALDITADASMAGGTSISAPHASFSNDYGGDFCSVTSSGSSGDDAVFEITLEDGEAFSANITVSIGDSGFGNFASLYLMPTCGAFDDTCLAGTYEFSSTNSLSYVNDSGATETVYLFTDNDGYSTVGDFSLDVEIVNPVCGDGTIEIGEECDDGNTTPGDACDENCQIEVICGDGFVRGSEECDDGNTTSGDGCSDACEIEPDVCGNGIVESNNNEDCDDGNTVSGDGCDANCETTCGDGFVVGDEECDDGNTSNGDGCSDACVIELNVCGNGVYEPGNGEECDFGTGNGGAVCTASCVLNQSTLSESSAPAAAIPDGNSAGITDTISVSGCATVDAVTVPMDITHTFRGDLIVTLTDPNGTTVLLHDRTGGASPDIIGNYPIDLTPAESLSAFDGVAGNGDWVLTVSDNAGLDTGTLDSWGLELYCQ